MYLLHLRVRARSSFLWQNGITRMYGKLGGRHPWYPGPPPRGAQHDRDAGGDGSGSPPVLRALLHRHLGAVRLHHQGAGAVRFGEAIIITVPLGHHQT